jgi:hypothetical protein
LASRYSGSDQRNVRDFSLFWLENCALATFFLIVVAATLSSSSSSSSS